MPTCASMNLHSHSIDLNVCLAGRLCSCVRVCLPRSQSPLSPISLCIIGCEVNAISIHVARSHNEWARRVFCRSLHNNVVAKH